MKITKAHKLFTRLKAMGLLPDHIYDNFPTQFRYQYDSGDRVYVLHPDEKFIFFAVVIDIRFPDYFRV
jgi:hypothetical protein